jgi:hypothetical protein
MKKKRAAKTEKKLELSTEAIRMLRAASLEQAAGGTDDQCDSGTSHVQTVIVGGG